MQHIGVSPFGVPHPTVFIRGTPATTLLAPPVTEEHKAEFQALRGITLNRYVSSKLVTAYTGKHGAAEHANWVNSLMGYFETMGLENTAVQAQLAVLTFQETAAAWWRAHRHHTPRFVFSFPQIVEWVRTELVPEAEPSRSVLAWQRLKFEGNVNGFLSSVRNLFVTNPLPLLTALTMVSDQFGQGVQARIRAAHAQAGTAGISITSWEDIIKEHVYSRGSSHHRPNHTPTTPSTMRPDPQADRQPKARMAQLVNELAAAAPWEGLGITEEEWAVRINSVVALKDPKTPAVPIKYGKRTHPCFTCGEQGHSWTKCSQRNREGKCGVCGFESHLTMQCAHRYQPRPDAKANASTTSTPKAFRVDVSTTTESTDTEQEAVAPQEALDQEELPATPLEVAEPEAPTIRACQLPTEEVGDQLALHGLWDALARDVIPARWAKVECQPKLVPKEDYAMVPVTSNPAKSGQLLIALTLNEVHTQALFDCGASHSFLSMEWVDLHQFQTRMLPKALPLAMFQDGPKASVHHLCKVKEVAIGPLRVPWAFLVMEDAAYPAVIGLDFIRRHSLLYDPRAEGIYIPRQLASQGTARRTVHRTCTPCMR